MMDRQDLETVRRGVYSALETLDGLPKTRAAIDDRLDGTYDKLNDILAILHGDMYQMDKKDKAA